MPVAQWSAVDSLAPDEDDPELVADFQRNNDFDYAGDSQGRQMPFGSYVWRMNPTKLQRLTDVNIHRLFRRGTTYGRPYDSNQIIKAPSFSSSTYTAIGVCACE